MSLMKRPARILRPCLLCVWQHCNLVPIDVKSYDERENTLTLLRLLALGNAQIKPGKLRNAEDVFADLDQAALP